MEGHYLFVDVHHFADRLADSLVLAFIFDVHSLLEIHIEGVCLSQLSDFYRHAFNVCEESVLEVAPLLVQVRLDSVSLPAKFYYLGFELSHFAENMHIFGFPFQLLRRGNLRVLDRTLLVYSVAELCIQGQSKILIDVDIGQQ